MKHNLTRIISLSLIAAFLCQQTVCADPIKFHSLRPVAAVEKKMSGLEFESVYENNVFILRCSLPEEKNKEKAIGMAKEFADEITDVEGIKKLPLYDSLFNPCYELALNIMQHGNGGGHRSTHQRGGRRRDEYTGNRC